MGVLVVGERSGLQKVMESIKYTEEFIISIEIFRVDGGLDEGATVLMLHSGFVHFFSVDLWDKISSLISDVFKRGICKSTLYFSRTRARS